MTEHKFSKHSNNFITKINSEHNKQNNLEPMAYTTAHSTPQHQMQSRGFGMLCHLNASRRPFVNKFEHMQCLEKFQ